MTGSTGTQEGRLRWKLETGLIGCVSPDAKYLARLNLRVRMDSGCDMNIYAEYDSCGSWEHVGNLSGLGLRPFTIPVRVRRCDHMRLLLEGRGDAEIYAITKTMEQGSDLV